MRLTVAQLRQMGYTGPIPEGRSTPAVVLPSVGEPKRKAAHRRFEMNWTESRYAEVLEGRRLCGELRSWEFERYTFRLGPEMTFTPDFAIEELDGWLTLVDTKNSKHIWEDATVKAKAAATLYPFHRWQQAVLKSGEWHVRTFKARED